MSTSCRRRTAYTDGRILPLRVRGLAGYRVLDSTFYLDPRIVSQSLRHSFKEDEPPQPDAEAIYLTRNELGALPEPSGQSVFCQCALFYIVTRFRLGKSGTQTLLSLNSFVCLQLIILPKFLEKTSYRIELDLRCARGCSLPIQVSIMMRRVARSHI